MFTQQILQASLPRARMRHVRIFLPAQGGRGREVIHPLLRPSYFQLLLSGGGAAPATGWRREAQLLPTNNQDLSLHE